MRVDHDVPLTYCLPQIGRLLFVALTFCLIDASRLSAADNGFIWVEGEAPYNTDMKPHPWYAGSVDKAELSGGGFISNFSAAEGHARYQFNVDQAGTYTLWIRANPVGDPKLDYQLNQDERTPVDFKTATDVVNIASDSKPDLRFIGWIKVGLVELVAGTNSLAFTFHSANNNHGSLDCFVLTQVPFTPNGKLKPGERLGTDEPGWWSFEPKPETFSSDAKLDLRWLNENEAGESGFVQASGDEFVLGNGKGVRFWGVNVPVPAASASNQELDLIAARFAKLGINIVRIHGSLMDRGGDDPTKIDPGKLDRYFYLINSLKKKGIYVHLSIYFVLWLQLNRSDDIPETDDALGAPPFGLLFFEPRMQDLYKSWVKQILTTKNPYSGRTLAEETSVAMFEIQNEDSLFFWTFNPSKMGAGPRALLETKFAAWLTNKYGNLEQALRAWSTAKHPDDSMTELRMGLLNAYEMSNDGYSKASPDLQKRIREQTAFLAQLQHQFYTDTAAYLHDTLHAKWPVSASNWTTVPGLEFLERYTYSGVDVIDKHGYFGGRHDGEGAGYSVRNGHHFQDKTALTDPESLPLQYVHLCGHPQIQTELAWNKPNRFIGEGELIASSYESLQDTNGVFFFAAQSGNWENNGGGNWPYMMPGEIGQSPAAALQYRRGDLQKGEVVWRDKASVDSLMERVGTGLVEGRNADFRATGLPNQDNPARTTSFDPLTFFVGRVERSLDPQTPLIAVDLGKYIDRTNKTIASVTGEIVWNYQNGLLSVNSPRSQAVTGFLSKASPIHLRDVVIDSQNEYATIHIISLDGEPLATSKSILIQAFTEEKMRGFKSENGEIIDIGRAPITVRQIQARLDFPGFNHATATALDEQGYARNPVDVQETNTGCSLVLPKDSLYTILTR